MRFVPSLLALPLLVSCLAPAARAADAAPVPYIEVKGTAERVLDYDRVNLTFDFSVEGRDSTDVTKRIAERLSKAVQALEAAGYKGPDVEVSGPRTEAKYGEVRETRGSVSTQTMRITGYESSAAVIVRTGDFSAISRLTGLMLDQGANMEQPAYYLARGDEINRELAPEAARDALARARRIIEGAGAKAGRILLITTQETPAAPRALQVMEMTSVRSAAAVDIPHRPGQAFLSYAVVMRVEIVQP